MDSLWALFDALTTMFSMFVALKILAVIVGVKGVGLWTLASSSIFALRFADININSALMRTTGLLSVDERRQWCWGLVVRGMIINALAFSILLVPSLLIFPKIINATVPIYAQLTARRLVPWLIWTSIANLLTNNLTAVAIGLGRQRLMYMIGTLASMLQAVIAYPVLRKYNLCGYALLQIFYFATQAVMAAWILQREVPFSFAALVRTDRSLNMMLWRLSSRLGLNTGLATLVDPISKALIGRFGGLSLIGSFEIIWRTLSQSRTLLLAPTQPLVVQMLRAKDKPALDSLYAWITTYCIAIGSLLVLSIPLMAVALTKFFGAGWGVAWMSSTTACLILSANVVAAAAYNGAIAKGRPAVLLISTCVWLAGIGVSGLLGRYLGSVALMAGLISSSLLAHLILVTAVTMMLELPFRARVIAPSQIYGLLRARGA